MTEGIRSYLLSVCAGAFFTALLAAFTPEGTMRKLSSFAGSLLVLILLLSPLAKVELQDLEAFLPEWSHSPMAEDNSTREQMDTFIKDRCRTYIEDKAAQWGMDLLVTIETDDSGYYPVPVKAIIRGTYDLAQKERLSRSIAEDLGIEADQQEWIRM